MVRSMRFAWEALTNDELLDVKLCDLGIKLEGTWLEEMVAKVCGELEERDLRLVPHFWLADEWFSPDGVPGVALPFYLAHKRLMRLEREQMFEVEGGTRKDCVRIIRHEVGHAVDHAFGLHRKRRYQQLFGKASEVDEAALEAHTGPLYEKIGRLEVELAFLKKKHRELS